VENEGGSDSPLFISSERDGEKPAFVKKGAAPRKKGIVLPAGTKTAWRWGREGEGERGKNPFQSLQTKKETIEKKVRDHV